MRYLYKYMKYRDGYFRDPTLRITQFCALNDPFEYSPSEDDLKNHFGNVGDSNDFEFWESHKQLHNCLVSFSATYDNLLMWSHYGDQHMGLVLKIDISKLCLPNLVMHSANRSLGASSIESPQPVFYSKKRKLDVYPASEEEKLIANVKDKTILEDAMLMKSDEWMYEKEYRIITSSKNCTHFFADFCDVQEILKSPLVKSYTRESVRQFCSQDESGNEKLIVDLKAVDPSSIDSIRFIAWALSQYRNSVYLYRIPHCAIKEIVFGMDFDKDKKRLALKDIADLAIDNVKVSEAQKNPHQFLLDLEEISLH